MKRNPRHLLAFILLLFFASGFTGLAYEVVWTRMLARVFGVTSYAVTTVLASYMGGLALGSYVFGKRIDRGGNPLRVYALLEAGIGLFALVLPVIITLIDPLYRSMYPALEGHFHVLTSVRLLLCFLLLLVPTTLMGGTLPVLSKAVAGGISELSERVGGLYAANTLGAVGGTLGAAFLLLPRLGLSGTTWVAALLNFAIFAAAMVASRAVTAGAPARPEDRSDSEEVKSDRTRKIVLLTFGLTGFAALSVEVVWTRVLALVIGTTVYAFATMLATFLLGLGLGSAVFARFTRDMKCRGRGLAALVAGIAFAVILSSAAFGQLPYVYMSYYERAQQGWGGLVAAQFALCGLIMLIPAFLMGGVFPMVAAMYARHLRRVGSEIGVMYAFNTVGSIFGSVAGSFIFLRFLGIQASLNVLFGIYVAAAVVLLLTIAEFSRRVRWMTAVSVLILGAVLAATLPGWDRKVMTSGVYRYAPQYRTAGGLKSTLGRLRLIFYRDGEGATVSVERFEDEVSLLIDGKADASTGVDDMRQQTLLAHIPLLAHPDPHSLLVIGLGSGVTLGCAERFNIDRIDCVELLENVVEASREFAAYNYDCLADPRVNLITGDGRNHMALTEKRYDVIVSHPTNPWISGVGDLFTREYFELARSRLNSGGIMCAWFQTYHMPAGDLKTAIRTFLGVFAHATLYMSNESDLIILGSSTPFGFDGRLISRMNEPRVSSDLRRVWISEPSDILCAEVARDESLRRWVGPVGPLHTDDNLHLEFSAGRMVLESTEAEHLSDVARLIQDPLVGPGLGAVADMVGIQTAARRTAIMASVLKIEGRVGEAMSLYDEAYGMSPRDPFVLHLYVENHQAYGHALLKRERYEEAARSFRRSTVEPDYPKAWSGFEGLAHCFLASGEYDSAAVYFRHSVRANPHSAEGFFNLGNLELIRGNVEAGIEDFLKALDILPEHPGAANNLARVYSRQRKHLEEAVRLAAVAVSADESARHYTTLGWAQFEAGDRDAAARALERAVELEPAGTEALYRLALLEAEEGHTREALGYLRELLALGLDDSFTRDGRILLLQLEQRGR